MGVSSEMGRVVSEEHLAGTRFDRYSRTDDLAGWVLYESELSRRHVDTTNGPARVHNLRLAAERLTLWADLLESQIRDRS